MGSLPSAMSRWLNRLRASRADAARRPTDPRDSAGASEAFRKLAENSLQGIIVHDGRHRLFANQAFADMYGFPDIAAVLSDRAMTQNMFPEDMPALQAEWQRILAGRQSWMRRRQRRKRLDGSLLWIDVVLGPVTWEGRPAIQGIQIDVTREVEAEAALRRSEARFRTLLEESLQGIAIHDGTQHLFVNDAFARMHGYPDTAAALGVEAFAASQFDDDRAPLLDQSRAILEGRLGWSRERVRRRRADGGTLWVDLMRGPLTWEGRPAIQVIAIDVTREVEAAAELRGNEARFRAVLDNLPHVFTFKSTDRRFRLVNREFERWYGVNAADAVGRTPEELYDRPVLAALVETGVRADEAEVIRSGRTVTRERRRIDVSGETRDIIATKFAVHATAGDIEGVGTILTDVTALKQAQTQLVQREAELRRNQSAILQVLRAELGSGSIDDRIRPMIALAGETLGVDGLALWQLDEPAGVVRCVQRWIAPALPYPASRFPAEVPLDDMREFYAALDQHIMLSFDDRHVDQHFAPFLDKHFKRVNISACIASTIQLPGGLRFYLGFSHHGSPRVWSVEDQSFVRSMAELIGMCFFQTELERREQALRRNQGAILQLLRDELNGGSIGDRLQRMLALAGEMLGVDAVAIWRFDRDGALLRCIDFWHIETMTFVDTDFPLDIPLADARELHEALERQVMLAIDDHRADRRFAAFFDKHFGRVEPTASLLTMIRLPDGGQGYLRFGHHAAPRAWSVEDQSFAHSMAELIGVSFFQHELERREAALRRNHEALVRVVRQGLLAGSTPQAVLNAIVQLACTTLGLRRVAVWTSGQPFIRSDRVCAAAWDDRLKRHLAPGEEPTVASADLIGWFTVDYFTQLQHDLMIALEDIETDPKLTETGRAHCRSRGVGARLTALVRLPDRVLGVVTFLAGHPRRWTAEDQAFARSIADLVAFAFLSERHREALAALDLVGQGLYVESERGEVIYANRLARRLAGAADDASAVALDRLPALPRERIGDVAGEITWRAPAGDTFELAVARTALPGTGAVTVIADITERKLREHERRELEAEMRQAAKLEAVGRLAGGIAHDFNNVLGTILGFASFLQEDLPAGSAQHSYAARIAKASEHAKEVVKQLLAFTRATDVERRITDLGTLVADSVDLLGAALPSSSGLVVDAGGEPLPVLVNNSQIHQILLNLCINANDALDGQPGSVRLSLARIAAGQLTLPEPTDGVALAVSGRLRPDWAYARLAVADDGAGMDTITLARVFDPFFTTKSPGHGTGLGLAVVHGIVSAYDGLYVVESRLGAGTTFSVYLPLAESIAADAGEASPLCRPRGSETVLVVDDEPDLLEMMRIGLGRLGYSVIGYSDPARALEAFRRDPDRWDIVVTDQVMPGINGGALIAKLREIRPRCPIILCTGFSDDATERLASEAGVAGFFLKPVEPYRIAETIRALRDA
jgi:PAS domain S-box-containing protein